MIDFPNAPTVGQQFTTVGSTWIWDGAKWTPVGAPNTTVQAMNDNRIINGDMRIDQRNSGASGTAFSNAYTIDRWQYGGATAGKITWGRNLVAGTPPAGFPYYLGFASASSYTTPAGENYAFVQSIEADMVSDFAWGTSSAQPVTLSFWVWASIAGTYSGSIRDYAGTRAYPFTFAAGTSWTKVIINIPGDAAGTWVMSGNAGSVLVGFDLGSGSTWRTAAGAWTAGNYLGVTGSVSLVATNNALFFLTGVKLEIGSIATPFNRQSLAKSLADCQRYYQTANCALYGYGAASGAFSYRENFAVVMRIAPAIAFQGTTLTNCSSLSYTETTNSGFLPYVTATATGFTTFDSGYTASAEL